MVATPHILLRDARDRLVELLGIGQPYPLQDLAVRHEQLKVAFNTSAKIPIENSQPGVLYQLHYKHELVERTPQGVWVQRTPEGKWLKRTAQGEWVNHTPENAEDVGKPIEQPGDGATLVLETCQIQEDITFEIFAQKQRSGKAAYLYQTATVKVGLDIQLPAQIVDAPYLEPIGEFPTAPRIIDYGQPVTVAIQNSQEGVVYDLVYLPDAAHGSAATAVALSAARSGNLHTLALVSQPLYEDIDLRVRVTKTFEGSARATETDLLEVMLPLKVRANPDLAVTIDPAHIIDFQGQATLNLSATQRSARYQLFQRLLRDRDFIHQATPDSPVIRVPVAGEADVQVRQPTSAALVDTAEDYIPLGEPQPGTDGDLHFPLPALTTDCLLLVQVQKEHIAQAAQGEQPLRRVSSMLQLTQATVVLVRPDPAPALRLQVWLAGAETTGDLLVTDGQPGVFYFFRLVPDGTDLGLPAYFHQRDDQNAQLNKGMEQLAVEVDFVVARDALVPLSGADPAQTPPLPPLVTTGPLPLDATLYLHAVKAQTRVATLLNTPYQLANGPEVAPEDVAVDFGAKTRIRIKSSRAREMYQLLLASNPLGEPVKGTGNNRLLETPLLSNDTTFELQITPDDPTVVAQVLRITVLVRPDPTLAVNAVAPLIDANSATVIQVEKSQVGVSYQLWVGEQSVGEPVAGGAAVLALPTGTLTTDTTFAVRATKLAHPELFVLLAQSVTVQVKPQADDKPGEIDSSTPATPAA